VGVAIVAHSQACARQNKIDLMIFFSRSPRSESVVDDALYDAACPELEIELESQRQGLSDW